MESEDPGTSLIVREPVVEAAKGLGDLFEHDRFTITEEEFDDRVYESVYGEKDYAWKGFTNQMLRSSCAFFAQEILTGESKPPFNGKFMVSEHHEEWDELLVHDRLCVLAPRFHGKTFFFDFAFPIWKAVYNRKGYGFIFSATQVQASKILGEIIEEIESNPELRGLVPDKKVMWGNTQIMMSNGHRIYARGYGTKIRGGHPDYIIVDDGLNDETIYSEMVRNKQIEYFKTAITNMAGPGGQIIVIGCVTPDTWISTESGLRRIGRLNPSDETPGRHYPLDLRVAGRRDMQRVNKFWVQGEVPTKRVTTEFGYRLEGSHRHPFLVMGENGIPLWRRADELSIGDYVAIRPGVDAWGPEIPVRIPVRNGKRNNRIEMPTHITEDLAYFVGLWTAEGSCEQGGRLMISNTDQEIREWLLSYPFGLAFKPNDSPGCEQTLRCCSKSFLEWMRSLGAVLSTAPKKVVPEGIMAAPKRIARAFLQGLFDGDGCAYVSNRYQSITLGTTSEALARDVQMLLLNFGILSSLRERPPAKPTRRVPQGGKYPLWALSMTGGEASRYMERIGFRLSRKLDAKEGMRESGVSKMRGIPNQAGLISLARKEKPRRPRSARANPPPLNISGVANHERPSRRNLGRVTAWFEKWGSNGKGVAGLRANLAENLAWMKIKTIEDRSSVTMDFVMEQGDHSFVSNGIVSHNTPFHTEDLYAALKKNPLYEFRKYQAIKDDGTALWPDKWSLKWLEKRKVEIGPISFAREFQTDPLSDEMSLFPMYLFKGEPVEQFSVKLGMPLKYWQEAGVEIFMGGDFAMSANVGADFTVVFTMGLDKYGNRWIVNIERAKGMPYQEQLSMINSTGRKYEASLIFLEDNQMQRIFGDELIRTTDLPIKKFTTGVQKHSLEKGVPSLRVLLENKKIRIPRGDAHSIEMTDIWINEMRSMTWQDGKLQSVGGHDDTVHAMWFADQAIRQGGFGFSFGTEEEYTEGNMDDLMAELTGVEPGKDGMGLDGLPKV